MEEKTTFVIENIICPISKIAAQMMCCQKKCTVSNAFVCNQKACDCQEKSHKNCCFVKIRNFLHNLNSKRAPMSEQTEKAVVLVQKIYDEMIECLSNSRQKFKDHIQYYGLNTDEMNLIKNIEQGLNDQITGELVNKVKQICSERHQLKNMSYLNVYNYWQQKGQQFYKFVNQLDSYFKDQGRVLLSKIIQKKQDQDFVSSLFVESSKELNLLYRGSQNKFDMGIFHKTCDGVKNTLTVVQTQFGNVIGGFNPYPWKSNNTWTTDNQNKAFIFSVTNKEKYPSNFSKKAIYNGSNIGPTFGEGCDISIQNNCNDKNNSYCNFPTTYNNKMIVNNQKAWTDFCGAKVGYNFKIRQIEVFVVNLTNVTENEKKKSQTETFQKFSYIRK